MRLASSRRVRGDAARSALASYFFGGWTFTASGFSLIASATSSGKSAQNFSPVFFSTSATDTR